MPSSFIRQAEDNAVHLTTYILMVIFILRRVSLSRHGKSPGHSSNRPLDGLRFAVKTYVFEIEGLRVTAGNRAFYIQPVEAFRNNGTGNTASHPRGSASSRYPEVGIAHRKRRTNGSS